MNSNTQVTVKLKLKKGVFLKKNANTKQNATYIFKQQTLK